MTKRKRTLGGVAATALALGVALPGLASAKNLSNECALVGSVYTTAPASALKVSFVRLDLETGTVIEEIEPSNMSLIKKFGGYEYEAYIPNDGDLAGELSEWAMRVDSRDAASSVFIEGFEQYVPAAWYEVLGAKTIAQFAGGNVGGRVELVAITKIDKAKGKKLFK